MRKAMIQAMISRRLRMRVLGNGEGTQARFELRYRLSAAAVFLALAVMIAMAATSNAYAAGSTTGATTCDESRPVHSVESCASKKSKSAKPMLVCKAKSSKGSKVFIAKGKKALGKAKGETFLASLSISCKSTLNGSIYYRVYKANKGWSKPARNGKMAGTKGGRRPIQAIKISLEGQISKSFRIEYRANVMDYGWMGWAKGGQPAGAKKLSEIRAVQVRLVKKRAKPKKPSKPAYFEKGKASAEFFYAKGGLTRSSLISKLNKAKGSGLKSFGCKYKLSSKAAKRLKKAMQAFRGDRLSFVMIDIKTGRGVSYKPNRKLYGASTIKGPYVAAVSKYRSNQLSPSVRSSMSSTVRVSDGSAYVSLRHRFGRGIMASFAKFSGIRSSEMRWNAPDYCYMSSKALAKLWLGMYWSFYRDENSASKWTRNLYKHPWNSFITQALKTPTCSKAGWYPMAPFYVLNDGGVVLKKKHPYVIAVMSSACGQHGKLRELVRAIDAVHSDMVSK